MQARSFFGNLTATTFGGAGASPHAGPRTTILDGVDVRTAAIFIIGAVIIVSFQSFGKIDFYDDHLAQRFDGQAWSPMFGYLYWFTSGVLWLFVLPVAIIALTPGMSLRDFGIGLGDWRFGVPAAALLYLTMVPILAIASFRPNFVDYYPMSDFVRAEVALYADGAGLSHLAPFLAYEAFYAAYFIGWEFFHRGFLTVGLSKVFGWYAILIVTIPFAILHLGKPMPEAYGAIIASVVLGWLAIRTRSGWYGFFLHASVAITMDTFAVLHRV
jgi:membrane protease YdiL (CAAX protease family)